MAEDFALQLNERLKSANCISLAIEKLTDMIDNSQLIIFVRYYDKSKKEFIEDLLGVMALKERTQGEDIYKALKSIVESNNIEMKSIILLITDGAPVMLSKGKELVGRILKNNPDSITYYCIIHQAVLYASLGDKYREVIKTIIKLVNFLRSTSALQHCFLRSQCIL